MRKSVRITLWVVVAVVVVAVVVLLFSKGG